MAGPQFAHIQTWSSKPNAAGQSIQQIIGEATREPEFSTHVDEPEPPRIIFGNPRTFAADHAAHVAARSTRVQMADGTERVRAIRSDRHTMASIVMSYPVPHSAIKTDEDRAALKRWEDRNMKWLRETYGDQLRVVMAHDDEEHPHIHAWLLPDDPGADATTLHPGKMAKKRVEAEAKADGLEPREAVKLGNRALKEAMTIWQDQYHEAVGVPEGLTRTGPKRTRLSREQWKAEKAAAVANAAALERAEAARAEADQIEAHAKRVREDAIKLSGVNKALQKRDTALTDRERAAEGIEDRATKAAAEIIQGAKTEARAILDDAEGVRAEVMADAMRTGEELHQERQHLARITKMVRAVVVKIGKKFGLDLDAKDLARDVIQIEKALSSPPEDPRPDTDTDGPGF